MHDIFIFLSFCTQAIEHYEQRIMDEKEREERLAVHLKKMISDLEHCQKQVN